MLVATTPAARIFSALNDLGVPRLLVDSLESMNRYRFVLVPM